MSETAIKRIAQAVPPYPFEAYAHIVSPLSSDDGGGYLITFPDLPGCMSDGETEMQAVANGRDAFASWVSARMDAGKAIPEPAYRPEPVPMASGRFITRLPKTIHAKLAQRAKAEGVSLNTLVLAFIAEGLGRKDTHA
ncbi:type II toxin-antitoxin system HicB family antitoxin [Noviherbaspirillum sedimenti]|uniref:Toxin-antitoxin system HicB family antitoxin n=1 Tax=Noviherbaspirillum sedimenti TaxID=2320865 RepID=A0A3A3FXF8_9BURK|nr:type II toxin-antitoxin system HicB family antitoxin [Noviherbaspirillum sedimenti]RJG00888.1 toxin-antitoxin system HicB family antitoxin [Noviherbaspirillum sedimenti]